MFSFCSSRPKTEARLVLEASTRWARTASRCGVTTSSASDPFRGRARARIRNRANAPRHVSRRAGDAGWNRARRRTSRAQCPSSVEQPTESRASGSRVEIRHVVGVGRAFGWRPRCSHAVVRALVKRGWPLGGSSDAVSRVARGGPIGDGGHPPVPGRVCRHRVVD
jgi:hypothetical protein